MFSIPKIQGRVLTPSNIEEIVEERGEELSTLSEGSIFVGRGFPSSWRDRECDHCGMWFTLRGIRSHQPACPVLECDELDYSTVLEATSKCERCGYWHPIHRLDCSAVAKSETGDWGEIGRWPVLLE